MIFIVIIFFQIRIVKNILFLLLGFVYDPYNFALILLCIFLNHLTTSFVIPPIWANEPLLPRAHWQIFFVIIIFTIQQLPEIFFS